MITWVMVEVTKFAGSDLSFENIVFRCSHSSEKYCQEDEGW